MKWRSGVGMEDGAEYINIITLTLILYFCSLNVAAHYLAL